MPKTPEQIRRRHNRLVAEADEADANVVYADLPGDEVGRYVSGGDDDTGTIYLQHGMDTADRDSVLAHELVHAQDDDQGPQPEHREALVDEEAADNIITAKAYRWAVSHVGENNGDIGEELDVSEDMVDAYERRKEREAAADKGAPC